MNLEELQGVYFREKYTIDASFGKIISFIDFANVNYWFASDASANVGLAIDIEKLKDFSGMFPFDARLYYGHDSQNHRSLAFTMALKKVFGRHRLITKPIQKVRHYLSFGEVETRVLEEDKKGVFVRIPKCNFDVEISVDALRLLDSYDTLCLFSGDADFTPLIRFLRSKGKKIILIKSGPILHTLRDVSHVVIDAHEIKDQISIQKQKPNR